MQRLRLPKSIGHKKERIKGLRLVCKPLHVMAGMAYLTFIRAQNRDLVAAHPERKSGNSSCVGARIRLYLSRSLIFLSSIKLITDQVTQGRTYNLILQDIAGEDSNRREKALACLNFLSSYRKSDTITSRPSQIFVKADSASCKIPCSTFQNLPGHLCLLA